MNFQLRIIAFALCVCVTFVYSEEQVSIGKVGGKSFYLLESSEMVNWDDAVTACSKMGLRLAAVENASENHLLSNFLVKRAPNAKVVHVWLGGNDKATEGKWVWTGTNKPLAYNNWDQGEPRVSKYYNCMYMIPVGDNTKARWRSNYCEYALALPLCQSV